MLGCRYGNIHDIGQCLYKILFFLRRSDGRPLTLDMDEPGRVAEAVKLMGIKHCVITSVNRDELKDKGSIIWASTIREVKNLSPETTIEVLIPDFKADWDALQRVIDEGPEVISHNMETVSRLYKRVRPQAKYERSLEQLYRTKQAGARTKSGFMLGLGETEDEVLQLMNDLAGVNLDVLTIGQYLQPTRLHSQVEEFVTPEKFDYYKEKGYEMGFDYVESGPLVRSSYHSERHVKSIHRKLLENLQ
jgi:lipoic acid synthetase